MTLTPAVWTEPPLRRAIRGFGGDPQDESKDALAQVRLMLSRTR